MATRQTPRGKKNGANGRKTRKGFAGIFRAARMKATGARPKRSEKKRRRAYQKSHFFSISRITSAKPIVPGSRATLKTQSFEASLNRASCRTASRINRRIRFRRVAKRMIFFGMAIRILVCDGIRSGFGLAENFSESQSTSKSPAFQTVRRLRPFCRRRRSVARPSLDLMRLRKPCVRCRLMLDLFVSVFFISLSRRLSLA